MACFHPLTAWRQPSGNIQITRLPPGTERTGWEFLHLPCGRCIGCRKDRAKAWALRCTLEDQAHLHTAFTTLTYDDAHLPPTLQRNHLQLFLKRLRKYAAGRTIRFFASGEYGEQYHRPHYHAILFGLDGKPSATDCELVQRAWPHGHTRTEPCTPARINYIAGYVAKKIGDDHAPAHDRVDPTTGEVYRYQPPFIQMSRRPGIGGHARQWPQSWKDYAIKDGWKMAVPRYLHEAWKKTATKEEQEKLRQEKKARALTRDTTPYSLKAQELITKTQIRMNNERRRYG